jgi:hypothetical protein
MCGSGPHGQRLLEIPGATARAYTPKLGLELDVPLAAVMLTRAKASIGPSLGLHPQRRMLKTNFHF